MVFDRAIMFIFLTLKFIYMKKSFLLSRRAGYALLATCMSFILVLGACSKNDDPIPEGDAYFKIVNSVEGSNPQDFYLNQAKITTSAVAYGEDSEYLTVRSGVKAAIFADEGATEGNLAVNLNISIGKSHTIFYAEDDEGRKGIVPLDDDLSAPASGKAKVRFVHLNNSLEGAVLIELAGGAQLESSLAFTESTEFKTIDPNIDINVTSVSGGDLDITPLVISGSEIEAGKIYTIWFTGDETVDLNYRIITHDQ